MNRLKTNTSAWVFGAGAFLVILFSFFPVIDKTKVDRRQAAIERGDAKQRQAESELVRRAADPQAKVTQEERDAVKKRGEQWEKDKAPLQEDVTDANIDLKSNGYWYAWGILLGFIMLALASIGWLDPNQSRMRRIVGSIIICAILLLIFIARVIKS